MSGEAAITLAVNKGSESTVAHASGNQTVLELRVRLFEARRANDIRAADAICRQLDDIYVRGGSRRAHDREVRRLRAEARPAVDPLSSPQLDAWADALAHLRENGLVGRVDDDRVRKALLASEGYAYLRHAS